MTVTRRIALATYLALLALVVVWELALAPATPVPRAFWAAIKAIPLLLPLYGLSRARLNTHVIAALVVMLYFCEGVAAVYLATKSGSADQLVYGALEITAALVFIGAATFHVRFRRHQLHARGSV